MELCEGHPEKMYNFKCWLRFYNMLDVTPLVKAIDAAFSKFHQYFHVDPMLFLSLPSLAFKAMFDMFKEDIPYGYSFSNQHDDIRIRFRENVLGGLTNIYHRHFNLYDDNFHPASRYAPNNQKFNFVGFYDFNAMVSLLIIIVYFNIKHVLVSVCPSTRYAFESWRTMGLEGAKIQKITHDRANEFRSNSMA